MTDRNKCQLFVGDRVKSLINDPPGLKKGELGTIIKEDDYGDPMIEWDEYNEHRHDGDGSIKDGHGWYIGTKWIELAAAKDLGEFEHSEAGNITNFLFDT